MKKTHIYTINTHIDYSLNMLGKLNKHDDYNKNK